MPHLKKDHFKMLWSGIGLGLAWVIGLIDFFIGAIAAEANVRELQERLSELTNYNINPQIVSVFMYMWEHCSVLVRALDS